MISQKHQFMKYLINLQWGSRRVPLGPGGVSPSDETAEKERLVSKHPGFNAALKFLMDPTVGV